MGKELGKVGRSVHQGAPTGLLQPGEEENAEIRYVEPKISKSGLEGESNVEIRYVKLKRSRSGLERGRNAEIRHVKENTLKVRLGEEERLNFDM